MNWFRKLFTRTAITNADGMRRLLSTRTSYSGVNVNESVALSAPAFYRGVDLVSDRIAGLDLNVYIRKDSGKEKATNHPAFRLVKSQCNPFQSSYQMKKTIQKDRMVHGNGYILIERNNQGAPVNLYRLDPNKTFPVIEGGTLLYGTIIDDEPRKLFPSDVLHLKGLGDGIVGFSIIDLLKDTIGSHVQATRHTATFFKGGAKPTYAIKLPPGLREEDKKRFREDWSNIHSGVEGKHVAALLPSGFDIETYGFNLEEIQLSELRQFSLIDFALICGIPASYLNATVNTSYSSLESEAKSFLANSLNGHLQAWEAECNLKLRTEKEKLLDNVYFDFDRKQLEQTDINQLSNALNLQKQIGAISTNEYRKALNLAPIAEEWADEYVMPLNLGFVDAIREKSQKELEAFDKPEPEPVQEPVGDQSEEDDSRLENLTRSTLDRLGARLRRAIDNKGTHDLIDGHLDVFVSNLGPLNERAEEISREYLENLQEELDHALPEQVTIDTTRLMEQLI